MEELLNKILDYLENNKYELYDEWDGINKEVIEYDQLKDFIESL